MPRTARNGTVKSALVYIPRTEQKGYKARAFHKQIQPHARQDGHRISAETSSRHGVKGGISGCERRHITSPKGTFQTTRGNIMVSSGLQISTNTAERQHGRGWERARRKMYRIMYAQVYRIVYRIRSWRQPIFAIPLQTKAFRNKNN